VIGYIICTSTLDDPNNRFIGPAPVPLLGLELCQARVFSSRPEAWEFLLRYFFTKQDTYRIYGLSDDIVLSPA
jgi:hypothetical protein